jgi:hypothetical protein
LIFSNYCHHQNPQFMLSVLKTVPSWLAKSKKSECQDSMFYYPVLARYRRLKSHEKIGPTFVEFLYNFSTFMKPKMTLLFEFNFGQVSKSFD